MADEPVQSLAEESAAAAASRGVAGFSRPFARLVFAERNLRRGAGSYASCVYPNPTMPAIVYPSAGPLAKAQRW
jgi:hypothetical protein